MWRNLGKIIVATGFEKFPKVKYIAQSGHTAQTPTDLTRTLLRSLALSLSLIFMGMTC